jgi:hydroxymethylglutaryl-CoA lyase
VCTEDLVHMLQAMGYDTGVDLEALLGWARRMPELVGHPVPGSVMKAGPSSRRYPPPDGLGSEHRQQPGRRRSHQHVTHEQTVSACPCP